MPNLIAPYRTPCWIRLLVHGLFVGAFKRGADGKVMLEIGALKNPSPNHQLSLEIWDRSAPDEPLRSIAVDNDSIVNLEINDPDGIYQYQQLGEFTAEETDDRYDFRWMADFETDFYDG